jgi:hypothetical protein
MLDLEDDLEELVARAKTVKSDAYVCSVCDATFATARELTVSYSSLCLRELVFLTFFFLQSHKDSAGHHQNIAPANRNRARKGRR